jgi:hypothetical protein
MRPLFAVATTAFGKTANALLRQSARLGMASRQVPSSFGQKANTMSQRPSMGRGPLCRKLNTRVIRLVELRVTALEADMMGEPPSENCAACLLGQLLWPLLKHLFKHLLRHFYLS